MDNWSASSADDIKLGEAFDSVEGGENLQRNLETFKHWAIINGLKSDQKKKPNRFLPGIE